MKVSERTLNEVLLERTTGAFKDKPYLKFKPIRGEPYRDVTYSEFGVQTRQWFSVLQSLGVTRGDRIAVLSESRPEWLINDFAALALGAVTVPMFPTLTAKQVEYIVQDSGAKIIVVSNDLQLGKALKLHEACPELGTIILFNASTKLQVPVDGAQVLFYPQLMASGGSAVPSLDFEHESKLAKPEDLITIIYTSGTTGTPKGVMLTHANLIANITGAIAVLPTIDHRDTALSFLPLCHAFERVAMYLFVVCNFTVAFAESIDTVAENMLEIRPTVMTGVPRFYERVYTRIMRMREKMPESRRRIFDWAVRVGGEYARGIEGKPIPIRARVLKPLADKLVLAKVRERTGGKIRFFVSGAAALPSEVGKSFTGFGLTLIEGYGMTECSPIISVTPYNRIKWGAVGFPLPNIEVKIALDGEILTRGPHVMKGYYNDPMATAEVIDSDGWMHTGDVGLIDADGYLHITDRKKHLFVSSGGKNIAPGPIESLFEQSRYIEQIMLVGDKRQFCTALIVPDYEAVREVFRANGRAIKGAEDLSVDAEVRKVIEVEVERIQKELATFERIRRFALLREPFSVENGMLTPTLKVKRKAVERHYAELIDSLYTSQKA